MSRGATIFLGLLALTALVVETAARGEDTGLDLPSTKRVGGRALRLGATIAPSELGSLDPKTVLVDARTLGISIVRIGVYWDAAQPEEKTRPDFGRTLALVKAAEEAGLDVVLTVGMKAPRWPEFYIPSWADPSPEEDQVSRDKTLRTRTLAFVEAAVSAFKDQKAIKLWQVENEPLNRAGEAHYGPNLFFFFGRHEARWIGADFLAEEVAKVRSLDSRRVLVNFWSADERGSSAPWTDSDYAKRNALALGDVIGLDVYPSTGGAADFTSDRVVAIPRTWLRKAQAAGKEAWIVEAQAEPWGSYQPDARAVEKLLEIESGLGYRTIFLWGIEGMEKLLHSKDAKEEAKGRELLAVVARFGHGSVPARDQTSPGAPSPTPGVTGALTDGR